MKVQFIFYQNQIMVVVGFTYNLQHDPPECYVAVPLEQNLIRSVLNMKTRVIPFALAREVTDMRTIRTIRVLYDGKI